MAYDANLIKTTSTGMSKVIPTPIVNELIKDLREASIYSTLNSFGVFKDYSGRWSAAGKTINIPTVADIAVASAVTEGVVTPIVGITPDDIQIVVGGIGNALQFTAESKQDVLNVFNDSYRDQLVNSMSKKLSYDIITEMNTTTNVQYALKSDKTAYDSSDIDANARLSYFTIMRARSKMSLAKPVVLLAHPFCAESVKAENRLSDNGITLDMVRSGILGHISGVFVVENTFVDSVTENSQTVYQNFMIAKNAIAFAWKLPLQVELEKDPVIYRSYTIAANMRYGMELRDVDLIYKIKSVSDGE